jgi:hypothetical protein
MRLTWLHLASRRVPAALLALAFVAAALRVLLHWTPATGTYSVLYPLTLATAAASVISATSRSPFGEPERATGGRLPWLRLTTTLALSCAACGALAAGTLGGHMGLGSAALLRDLIGLTGGALLAAAITGASLSWTIPLAYLVLSTYAIGQNWTTPWLWPARPSPDHGAAICAVLVFAAGTATISLRGARDALGHDT